VKELDEQYALNQRQQVLLRNILTFQKNKRARTSQPDENEKDADLKTHYELARRQLILKEDIDRFLSAKKARLAGSLDQSVCICKITFDSLGLCNRCWSSPSRF